MAAGVPAAQSYPVFSMKTYTTTLRSEYPATLQGQQNIEIRPKIDGYIEHIYIDEGATVKKGQLLFKINAPQYEQDVKNALAADQQCGSRCQYGEIAGGEDQAAG